MKNGKLTAPSSKPIEELTNSTLKIKREKLIHPYFVLIVKSKDRSVNLDPLTCEYRDLDPNTKVNGCKRQLLADADGRLWAARVHGVGQGGRDFGHNVRLIVGTDLNREFVVRSERAVKADRGTLCSAETYALGVKGEMDCACTLRVNKTLKLTIAQICFMEDKFFFKHK